MRNRKAFTLVELLVVIGIIAVFIAILLPVLKSAREQARMVKCQSNIRTILQGMFMYANDNHGTLPIPGNSSDRNKSFGIMMMPPPTYYLYNYTRNFSYTFNNHLEGLPNGAFLSGVKLSQIVNTSFKILVFEEEQPPARPGDEAVTVDGGVLGLPTLVKLTRRHQGRADVGFADGHVEAVDGQATFPDIKTDAGNLIASKYMNLTSDWPAAYP